MQIAGTDNLRAPREVSPQLQEEKLGQSFQDILRAQAALRIDQAVAPPVTGVFQGYDPTARRQTAGPWRD